MGKRRIRVRTTRRKSPRGRQKLQPLRPKTVKNDPLAGCRNYVTETHYEL
jgi:hypothetical protein